MTSPNTIKNLSGAIDGISSDETGINVAKFECVIEPEFLKFIAGKYGPARGAVIAPMKLNVTIEGEILGNTGIMAAVATVAYAVANSTAWFGAPTTGLYLMKATVTMDREEGKLQSVALEFWSLSGIP